MFTIPLLEQFYWSNISQHPIPLFNNIIGVVVHAKSFNTKNTPLTIKVLIMQPNESFITVLIQCDQKEYGMKNDCEGLNLIVRLNEIAPD